jgi:hypothetical protein
MYQTIITHVYLMSVSILLHAATVLPQIHTHLSTYCIIHLPDAFSVSSWRPEVNDSVAVK